METTNNSSTQTDISPQAISILKTMLLLERNYGLDYLLRLLQGDTRYGFKKEAHAELETFGDLSEWYSGRTVKLFESLIRLGMIEVRDPRYGALAVTATGKAFMDQPRALMVYKNDLNESTFDRLLRGELKRIRREISEGEGRPMYEIFTNYHLRAIISHLPKNEEELAKVPGLPPEQVSSYGEQILAAIRRVEDHPGEVAREYRISLAFTSGHQEVKELFESGKNIQEIADARGLSPVTISQYLEHLHEAKQIDFRAWIEGHIEAKALNKGVEFFKQVKNPRLTEAKDVLNMDFETLRLCRFYAESAVAA